MIDHRRAARQASLVVPGLTVGPSGFCAVGATATCSARGSLGAVIYSPNRNTAHVAGMVARVDWTIEAGVGTTDDGTAVASVEPQPTRNP
jgi:hypothetical protein